MLDNENFLTLRLNDDFQLEIGGSRRERISNWKSAKRLRLPHRLQVSHLFWCHLHKAEIETL